MKFFLKDSFLLREEFIISDSSSPEENNISGEKISGFWRMRDLSVFAIQCYKFLLCYIVR